MGRAVYGNPWLFNRERRVEDISLNEKFAALLEHAHLFVETFGDERSFIGMRKHLMAYASGFPGAKEFRISLENIECVEDVEQAVEAFRKGHGDLLKVSWTALIVLYSFDMFIEEFEDRIHTVDAREHILLEIMRGYFGMTQDEMFREMHNMVSTTVKILKEKGIEIPFSGAHAHAHMHASGGCPGSKVIDFKKPKTQNPRPKAGVFREISQPRAGPYRSRRPEPASLKVIRSIQKN